MSARSKLAKFFHRHFNRAQPDWNQNGDFSRFTRGRFVSREAEQMAACRVRFDMNELCKIAGDVVGKRCVNVEKCLDGMYSKAFLLTMDDGMQVVAKDPKSKCWAQAFYDGERGVDYGPGEYPMRNVLKTPVPKVLEWNSCDENPVKAEYVIMEKARGVQLGSVWSGMELDQKVKIIKALGRYQREWSRISSNRIGSVYYARDLPEVNEPTHDRGSKGMNRTGSVVFHDDAGMPVTDTMFAIGPIVGREWMDHGRASINCDRGPWTSVESYRRAVVERDVQAIRTLDLPSPPFEMLCGPSLYQPTKEKKLRACAVALRVLPHVLPKGQWASKSHLWHDDLHEENIFVDASDPTVIVDIIDWQSTFAAPLFDHNKIPALVDHRGPVLFGLDRPPFPDLPEEMDPGQKQAALKLYDEQALRMGFKYMLKGNIHPVFEAVMYDESNESGVVTGSYNHYAAGEAYFLGNVLELESPHVHFSEAEKESIIEDAQNALKSMHIMEKIQEHLGPLFPGKGLVRPELYDESKAALRRVKEQILGDFSKTDKDRRIWEQVWPFDD